MNTDASLLSRMNLECVVCQAFPGHRGPHFTRRDITSYMFAHRARKAGAGGWVVLEGTFSAVGNQIMMSTRMPADLDSMEVEGIWLMEHKEELEGEPQPLRAAGAAGGGRPSTLGGWLGWR